MGVISVVILVIVHASHHIHVLGRRCQLLSGTRGELSHTFSCEAMSSFVVCVDERKPNSAGSLLVVCLRTVWPLELKPVSSMGIACTEAMQPSSMLARIATSFMIR